MEFVDGVNLRRLLDTGKLASEEALAIVPQVCDALQYAHDHGVVHRDIKPENVLLDKEGRVKIADFGVAKLVGRDASDLTLTGAGQIMGTPQYMAPEQIEHPLEVDHRADIYSLGVVFYQMLTGELPLGRFAPPSKKVQIDVRLDEVVLRALEKEPERRYQQVSEIKTRVETIVKTPPGIDSSLLHSGERQGVRAEATRSARLAVVVDGGRRSGWEEGRQLAGADSTMAVGVWALLPDDVAAGQRGASRDFLDICRGVGICCGLFRLGPVSAARRATAVVGFAPITATASRHRPCHRLGRPTGVATPKLGLGLADRQAIRHHVYIAAGLPLCESLRAGIPRLRRFHASAGLAPLFWSLWVLRLDRRCKCNRGFCPAQSDGGQDARSVRAHCASLPSGCSC